MDGRLSRKLSVIEEMVSSQRLGERIRELRRKRDLTLEGLAEQSGVSRAMISKVERGEKNPTLVVTAKFAEAFELTLSQLVGVEEQKRVVIVPAAERMMMTDPSTGFQRQLLSPTFEKRAVEFIRNVVPKGSTSGTFPPHKRGVEEYIVVETGRLKAILEGQEYVLEEGDSVYFEADITHRFDNISEKECSYYLVIDSSQI